MQDLDSGRRNPVMVAAITGAVFSGTFYSWAERRLEEIGDSLQCNCISLGNPVGSLDSLLAEPPRKFDDAKESLDAKWTRLYNLLSKKIEITPDNKPLLIFSHFYGFDIWLHAALLLSNDDREKLLRRHYEWVTKLQHLGVGLPFYFDLTCNCRKQVREHLTRHLETVCRDAGGAQIPPNRINKYVSRRQILSEMYFHPKTGQQRSLATIHKGSLQELDRAGRQMIDTLRGVMQGRFGHRALADAAD